MNKNKQINTEDSLDFIDELNLEDISVDGIEQSDIKDNFELVECPNCGFKNIIYARKCTKCNHDLDKYNKSCPKCGKINANNVQKCDCGFNFKRKKIPFWVGLLLSIIIVLPLFFLYKYKPELSDKFSGILRVILLFVVIFMVLNMFFNKSNDVVAYSAEVEMFKKHKELNKMKKKSSIAVIAGIIVAVIYLFYYLIFK